MVHTISKTVPCTKVSAFLLVFSLKKKINLDKIQLKNITKIVIFFYILFKIFYIKEYKIFLNKKIISVNLKHH